MRVLIRIPCLNQHILSIKHIFGLQIDVFSILSLLIKNFTRLIQLCSYFGFFKVKWMLAYSFRNISHKYSLIGVNSAVDRLKIECLPSSAYTTFAGTSQLLAHFGHYNVYFMSREDLTIVSCFLFPASNSGFMTVLFATFIASINSAGFSQLLACKLRVPRSSLMVN